MSTLTPAALSLPLPTAMVDATPCSVLSSVAHRRAHPRRLPPSRRPAIAPPLHLLPSLAALRPNRCDSTPRPVLIFCMSEGTPTSPDRTVHRMCEYRTAAPMRGWRNRQTRWIQVPVPERAWGFNSPLAHSGTPTNGVLSHRREGRHHGHGADLLVVSGQVRPGSSSDTGERRRLGAVWAGGVGGCVDGGAPQQPAVGRPRPGAAVRKVRTGAPGRSAPVQLGGIRTVSTR